MLKTPCMCMWLHHRKWNWLDFHCAGTFLDLRFANSNLKESQNPFINWFQIFSIAFIYRWFLPSFLHGLRMHEIVSIIGSHPGMVEYRVRFFSPIPHRPTHSPSIDGLLYVPSQLVGVGCSWPSSVGCGVSESTLSPSYRQIIHIVSRSNGLRTITSTMEAIYWYNNWSLFVIFLINFQYKWNNNTMDIWFFI